MASASLAATLNLAHITQAAGGNSNSLGPATPYATGRSHTGGIIRIRINSWPNSPAAAARATAIRFSLRRASGTVITNSVQINRGNTGWVSFFTPGGSSSIPAGSFFITGRARGFCNYSTPGGSVYDPVGHEFSWSGTIEYSTGAN